MTDGAIHTISLMIGELKGEVKALRESNDSLNRVWGERENGAKVGRQVLHDKFDQMRADFNFVEAKVENISVELAAIKPAIEEFKNQRQRAIGARGLGRWLWAAMLTAAGGIGWVIHEWLSLGAPRH